jgi:hypothetical protein
MNPATANSRATKFFIRTITFFMRSKIQNSFTRHKSL